MNNVHKNSGQITKVTRNKGANRRLKEGAAEADVIVRVRRCVVKVRGPTPIIRAVVPIAPNDKTASI